MKIPEDELYRALDPVIKALEKLGLWYYVGGSVASSVYGVGRSTLDVDVISNLDRQMIHSFCASLKGVFYLSEDHIQLAIDRKSSFNLIHLASGVKVDIFVSKDRLYDRTSSARRRLELMVDAQGTSFSFYVASPEDIILAKLEWYRMGGCESKTQWADILGVLRVQGKNLDQSYLKEWAKNLGVQDLLIRASEEQCS